MKLHFGKSIKTGKNVVVNTDKIQDSEYNNIVTIGKSGIGKTTAMINRIKQLAKQSINTEVVLITDSISEYSDIIDDGLVNYYVTTDMLETDYALSTINLTHYLYTHGKVNDIFIVIDINNISKQIEEFIINLFDMSRDMGYTVNISFNHYEIIPKKIILMSNIFEIFKLNKRTLKRNIFFEKSIGITSDNIENTINNLVVGQKMVYIKGHRTLAENI